MGIVAAVPGSFHDRNVRILEPVSYTHLDVYKRQGYGPPLYRRYFPPFRRNGAWLSFPRGGWGRICYYDAVRMDDEMPLKLSLIHI